VSQVSCKGSGTQLYRFKGKSVCNVYRYRGSISLLISSQAKSIHSFHVDHCLRPAITTVTSGFPRSRELWPWLSNQRFEDPEGVRPQPAVGYSSTDSSVFYKY
jgi:hypothetical protein